MAVCSEIHTKHISTLCGQNVELLNVKPCVSLIERDVRCTIGVGSLCGLSSGSRVTVLSD